MKWIDASERLPEKMGSYLVTTKNGFIQVARFHKNLYGKGEWGGNNRNCVIAWMELPKAFKK